MNRKAPRSVSFVRRANFRDASETGSPAGGRRRDGDGGKPEGLHSGADSPPSIAPYRSGEILLSYACCLVARKQQAYDNKRFRERGTEGQTPMVE